MSISWTEARQRASSTHALSVDVRLGLPYAGTRSRKLTVAFDLEKGAPAVESPGPSGSDVWTPAKDANFGSFQNESI
jgi:hypothetical protein